MMQENIRKAATILAKTINALLHPLLMPLYGLLIIFSAPTIIGYLPFSVKKTLLILILINNVLLPFLFIPYFRIRNLISSWNPDSRKERILPLISTSFFYSVTFLIIFRYHIPGFIKAFLLASAVLAISATVISIWQKISVHSMGAGAIAALVAVLSVKMNAPLPWLMAGVIICAGMIMSSRLWLNSDEPRGVWLGFFTGFILSGLMLSFF